MDKLLVVGTGGEGLAFINAMEKEPSYKIEAAMFPEKEGYTTIDAAVAVFQGKEVPPHIVSPTAALVGDDWKKYYDYDGKTRTIKWDAVNALQPPAKCMKTAADLKK
jgi:ribose transport system substrate-binding protein